MGEALLRPNLLWNLSSFSCRTSRNSPLPCLRLNLVGLADSSCRLRRLPTIFRMSSLDMFLIKLHMSVILFSCLSLEVSMGQNQ